MGLKYSTFTLREFRFAASSPSVFFFEDTVSKLRQLFGIRTSLFSKQYLCFQLSKQTEENCVAYAATVNKWGEDFELNRITADQFKSVIFICALQSLNEVGVRARLLAKLELDGEGECKLETLINECQRFQNLQHDTALVKQKLPIAASVCAVKQKNQQLNSSAPHSKDSKTNQAFRSHHGSAASCTSFVSVLLRTISVNPATMLGTITATATATLYKAQLRRKEKHEK